jgi:5-methylcytosine-specific restriction endonuclease McrA
MPSNPQATSLRFCVLCDKEKQVNEFKKRQAHEPLIKEFVCRCCYPWLKLKVKKHGQRAGDTLDVLVWLQILENSYGHCAYCKEFFGFRLLTIEHIIPICGGGTNDSSNITAVCKSCNSKKGSRIP